METVPPSSQARFGNPMRRLLTLLMGGLLPALALAEGGGMDPFESEVVPLVREFCWECHRGTKAKGGVDLV